MPATAECVRRIRRELDVFGACLPDASRFDDLRIAVSEACSNVVVHAYPDSPGPIELAAEERDGALVVRIRDEGCGVRADDPTAGAGFGLGLMRTLADAFSLETGADGTRVLLSFASRARAAVR